MRFSRSTNHDMPLACLAMLALSTLGSAYDSFSIVYHFPNTPYTDVENIAVRSNGQLLLDTITGASTYLLDPNTSSPTPQLLHTYPGSSSALGITETHPDVFAIVVGNYSTTTFQGVQGSFAIWTLDLRGGLPGVATKVTTIPDAKALNGATTVSGSETLILVADSGLGAIWRVDISNGAYSKVIQNSALAPSGTSALGINGIRSHGSKVYFTNSAKGTFGALSFSSSGNPTSNPTTISTTLSSNYTFDDFAVDTSGNAYISNHPNQVSLITISGSQSVIENSASFDQPSSAAFGRTTGKKCTLYVVTGGTPGSDSGAVLAVQAC